MTDSTSSTIDAKDVATFTDLKGRPFTLRLPWSKFESLHEALNIDLTPQNVEQELLAILDNYDIQFNVIAYLVADQLQALNLTPQQWKDDFFGCVDADDDDIATPLEASGLALAQVVTGFIPTRTKRREVRDRLRLLQRSLNAMHEKNVEELGSVSPDQIADLLRAPQTKGLTLQQRLAAEMDSAKLPQSSGASPDDSASTPATTPSDS
tara:strand:- start:6808 stop:7434 length:627 start_codon:yes stop_codon:yes gene_type:complete